MFRKSRKFCQVRVAIGSLPSVGGNARDDSPAVVGAGLAVKSRPVFGAVGFAVVGAPGKSL